MGTSIVSGEGVARMSISIISAGLADSRFRKGGIVAVTAQWLLRQLRRTTDLRVTGQPTGDWQVFRGGQEPLWKSTQGGVLSEWTWWHRFGGYVDFTNDEGTK